MAYENNDNTENNEKKMESVFSKRIRAGKRRTYFFDIRATRGNDYYLTITESRKRFDDNGYDRHKIFVYKEDFNKFIKALSETIDYVKTDLMPDFDFDAFNHEYPEGENGYTKEANTEVAEPAETHTVAAVAVKEEIAEPLVVKPEPVAVTEPIITDNGAAEQVDKW